MFAVPMVMASDLACSHWKNLGNHAANYFDSQELLTFLPQSKIISKEAAYLIQACIVSSKKEKVIGFKAGLIDETAQIKFKAKEPVFGVLTQANELQSNIIEDSSNKKYLIEAELAYKLKIDINSLLDLDLPIPELVSSVAPAIEVPAINFEVVTNLTANEIIAANAGATYFTLGKFVPLQNLDVNKVEVKITLNGLVVGPHTSMLPKNYDDIFKWLIKKAYTEGYALEKGTIFLIGSITKPKVLTKGDYQISFKGLQTLALYVK